MIPIIVDSENSWSEEKSDKDLPQPSKREKEWEDAIRDHMKFEHGLFRKQRSFFDGLSGV